MSVEENKAAMLRYYQEVWARGDLAAGDELVALDFVDHMPKPGQAPGREGHHQGVRLIRAAFPDARFTIDDIIAEGDKVVGRWTMDATHRGEIMGIPATGRPVRVTGIDIARFEGGRLAELWHQEDILGLMQQLGAIPR